MNTINITTPITVIDEINQITPSNYEEYVVVGLMYREIRDRSQWEIGRLAYELSEKNKSVGGDYKLLLKKFANDIGIRPETLSRYKRTYQVFKVENEFPETHLSFSHYEFAAKSDDPVGWLEKAAENDWSTRQLLYEMGKPEEEQEQETIECPYCHHHIPIT